MADIYDWSLTPATNGAADSDINWSEGMDPDQVNDSARQMMTRVAEVLDDIAPTRTTTGTGNAYAITSAAVSSGSYNDGEIFSFIIDRANTSAATINVNGRGAVALRPEIGREFAAGELRANQPIISFYRSASNEVLAVGSGYHVNALTSGALTQSVVGRLMKVGTPYLSMSATVEAGSIRLTQTTQTLNKADWPELSSWLSGKSYPWGSTSTTFNLPPAAGYFLRFAATSTAIDTSGARTAGSTQSDQNKAHTHGAGTLSGTTAGSTVVYTDTIRSGVQTASSGGAFDANIGETTASRTSSTHTHTFTVTSGATGSSGGDEVRVKNVAFHVDVFASSALATGALAQFGFSYAFDAPTTSSDPGSGNVRLNNATLASVTEIYISETDSWGVNISGFLSTIENGVRVRLSKIGAQASTVLFTASGAPTDNGGWRTIPGAVTVSGGSFTAGDSMAFEQFSGAAGDAGDPGAGIDWQGAWLTATAYVVADGVSNNGSSYICTSAHTSGASTEPGVGASWATVWDVIAAKGANGSGSGDMIAANNLTDVASAATAFANIKQSASETATGVVELATDAETVTGTSTVLATHPSGVKAAIDAAALTFKTIAVSGQSDVVADSRTDTLTLVAGTNMSITTNASTDTVTFTVTGSGTVPYNFLTGLTLSRNSGTPTTQIDMAIGQAADSTNALLITTTGVLTANCATTGANGLDTGALANNTWYHVFLIALAAGATPAILVSTSASSPTMPGSYIYKRRIGSVRTNGSAQFIAFTNDGDYFLWSTALFDVNTTTPGTSAVTSTLTVPTGVNVHAIMNVHITATPNASRVIVSDLAMTDVAPSSGAAAPGATTGGNSAQDGRVGPVTVRTNTSAQVRYRCDVSDGGVTMRINTLGWLDYRGR